MLKKYEKEQLLNICKHCGDEYNHILPNGYCAGCLNYLKVEHYNKLNKLAEAQHQEKFKPSDFEDVADLL